MFAFMTSLPFCIKRRYNPQLGIRFTAMGQLSEKDIKEWEAPLYGSNSILRFDSFEEYEAKCKELGIKVK